MNDSSVNCYFCNSTCTKSMNDHNRLFDNYDCPICGYYALFTPIIAMNYLNEDEKIFISCVLNEKRLHKDDSFFAIISENNKNSNPFCDNFYYISTDKLIEMFPKKPNEILERTLINLKNSISQPFAMLHKEDLNHYTCFSRPKACLDPIISCLCRDGYINIINKKFSSYSLTMKAWEFIEKINTINNSDKAFIAMWFNEKTDAIQNIIKKAIEKAGYYPIIANDDPHNDFIMNKILNHINESKFVIAEFTTESESKDKNSNIINGVRGGVYFEAGYARAKGKEVIHMCKDDHEIRKRLHFDILQINTILWTDKDIIEESTLINKIYHNIIFNVGKGPLHK